MAFTVSICPAYTPAVKLCVCVHSGSSLQSPFFGGRTFRAGKRWPAFPAKHKRLPSQQNSFREISRKQANFPHKTPVQTPKKRLLEASAGCRWWKEVPARIEVKIVLWTDVRTGRPSVAYAERPGSDLPVQSHGELIGVGEADTDSVVSIHGGAHAFSRASQLLGQQGGRRHVASHPACASHSMILSIRGTFEG